MQQHRAPHDISTGFHKSTRIFYPYPEPVYTGWYTGIPLGDPTNITGCTGAPLEKLSCPKLECHWRNSDFCSLHWNTTGRTITLLQPTHTQAHVVKQSSIHASLKWRDDGTTSNKWTGLWKSSFFLECTALQCIQVLLFKRVSTSISLCACLGYENHCTFCAFGVAVQMKWA